VLNEGVGDIKPLLSQGLARPTAFLTAFFRRYLQGASGVNDNYLNGTRTIETLEAFDITVEAQP